MKEESDKTTDLKKAYAEMILNTTKESAARVLISDRNSSQIHHNLNVTKDEALRLLVRLKQMIDAKTVEAEIISVNKQREIDLLEAQLQEAEDIITDLRFELRLVRDKLEKARILVNKEVSTMASDSLLNQKCGGNGEIELEKAMNVVDKEQETISATPVEAFDSVQQVVVESLHPPNQEVADTCFSVTSQSSLHDGDDDEERGGNGEKKFNGLSVIALKGCECELDGNICNKKLELSLNGCTQRIHALERKSSSCVNEEERPRSEVDGEENLSLIKTRSLVLALRSRSAEVVTTKPLNGLGTKKSRKVKGRRKKRWGKRKATKAASVRSQTQLLKPCQSQSVLQCSNTIMEKLDVKDTHMSVENEEVDALNACNGLEEHLQCNGNGIGIIRKGERSKNVEILGDVTGVSSPVNPTDHMVEAFQESNLVSIDVEDGENETKLKPRPCLTPGSGSTNAILVSVNAMNQSTEKDLHSKKEDESKCEGEEDNVVSSTKMVSELVNPSSDAKATVVSDKIRESSRADGNRLLNLKYTFQRKRKREQKGGR